MNPASSASPYDSASSRAHAPHAGAALKSTSSGLCWALAWLSAASMSLVHETAIGSSSIMSHSNLKLDASPDRQVQNLTLINADRLSPKSRAHPGSPERAGVARSGGGGARDTYNFSSSMGCLGLPCGGREYMDLSLRSRLRKKLRSGVRGHLACSCSRLEIAVTILRGLNRTDKASVLFMIPGITRVLPAIMPL